MKFDKLGWFIAVALAGAIFGMGFQGPTQKFGCVDMQKVFNDADETKANNAKLQDFVKSHIAVLQFIQANQGMNPNDVTTYSTLTFATNPSPTEQAQLTKITNDAEAATSAWHALVQKQNPSPDDIKQLNEFSSRRDANRVASGQLEQQYDQAASKVQADLRDQVLQKVRAAVASVSKKDGYTTVFATECAPYSANDLTTDTLAQMNKK